MNKLVTVASLALVVSIASIGSASALSIKFGPLLLKKDPGTMVEVGEPFQPFEKTADVRETCEMQGGLPVRQFNDAGQLVWVCKL